MSMEEDRGSVSSFILLAEHAWRFRVGWEKGVTALKVASVSGFSFASIASVLELLIGQLCSLSNAELHLQQ